MPAGGKKYGGIINMLTSNPAATVGFAAGTTAASYDFSASTTSVVAGGATAISYAADAGSHYIDKKASSQSILMDATLGNTSSAIKASTSAMPLGKGVRFAAAGGLAGSAFGNMFGSNNRKNRRRGYNQNRGNTF